MLRAPRLRGSKSRSLIENPWVFYFFGEGGGCIYIGPNLLGLLNKTKVLAEAPTLGLLASCWERLASRSRSGQQDGRWPPAEDSCLAAPFGFEV